MSALDAAAPGKRLCVVGYGTAGTLHTHAYTVTRQTKTLTVAMRENGKGQRRFRTSDGREVPRSDYGGVTAATTCQKRPTPKADRGGTT